MQFFQHTSILKPLTFLAFFCVSTQAAADWSLNNAASTLNFISIKKGSIAEVHRFDQLSGSISEDGQVDVAIDLNSVNTTLEVRDKRMKDHLFETSKFSTAKLYAEVDAEIYTKLAIGARLDLTIPATLSLHGETKPIDLLVTIVRQSATTLLVMSKSPAIINVADYGLTNGVNQLMELAKLPSIAQAVPVTFVLSFDANEN